MEDVWWRVVAEVQAEADMQLESEPEESVALCSAVLAKEVKKLHKQGCLEWVATVCRLQRALIGMKVRGPTRAT